MSEAPKPTLNVKQVVPFLRVSDMGRSVRFYIDGLGCTMKQKWIAGEKLRWCWLELGGAALMLQTYVKDGPHAWNPVGKLGEGVRSPFNAKTPSRSTMNLFPVVSKPPSRRSGIPWWVTSLSDPEGYRLEFESRTDTPEETKLSELDR